MITFVINLHGSLEGLHLSSPLFYPLKAAGTLIQVGGKLSEIESIFERVRLLLQSGHGSRVRCIFLLDLPECYESSTVFDASLSYRLAQIQYRFLHRISELGYETTDNHAIILDSVKRNSDEGLPTSILTKCTWEFDVNGVVDSSAGHDFLFTKADLQSIDDAWGAPLIIGSHSTLDAIERTDTGLAGLSPELGNALHARIINVLSCVETLVIKKKESAEAFLALRNDVALLFAPGYFSDLLESFRRYLRKLQLNRDISPLLSLKPSQFFQLEIGELFGFQRFTHGLKVLQVKFPGQPLPTYRENLVKLAYLTLFLSSRTYDLVGVLKSHTVFSVEIELDPAVISAMYHKHIALLECVAERTKNEIKDGVSGQIEIYDEASSLCNQDWENAELPEKKSFSLFAGHDAGEWGNWLVNMGDCLMKIEESVHLKLEKCSDELRTKGRSSSKKDFKDLEQTVVEFGKKHETLRNTVMKSRKPDYEMNWSKETFLEDKEFRELVERRPSHVQAACTFLVGVLCLYAAYASGSTIKLAQDASRFLVMPLAMLFISVLIVVGLAINYHKQLSRIVSEVHGKGKLAMDKLKIVFNDAKEFVQNLAKLDIYRRNLENAETVCEQATRKRLLLQFHRDQLLNHVSKAQGLLAVFPAWHPAEDAPPPTDATINRELPVFANKVYYPTECAPHEVQVEVACGTTVDSVTSSVLAGLKKVCFGSSSLSKI